MKKREGKKEKKAQKPEIWKRKGRNLYTILFLLIVTNSQKPANGAKNQRFFEIKIIQKFEPSNLPYVQTKVLLVRVRDFLQTSG